MDIDSEAVPEGQQQKVAPIVPPQENVQAQVSDLKPNGWPFDATTARKMQEDAGKEPRVKVPLESGIDLNLVLVPSGEFIMGDTAGYPDERPVSAVKIERPFWMSDVEISNKLFAQFDPKHDSRYQDRPGKDHSSRGFPANEPDQPVVRVSCDQAMAFCAWLSRKTGRKFSLPTEAQWEWGCRCGSEKADAKLFGKYITRWGAASAVGASAANVWGLKDMYGNVWEWTRSAYRPYPYKESDGRNEFSASESRAVRGGSWQDNGNHVRAGVRLSFQPYRALHNVGFRVVCE